MGYLSQKYVPNKAVDKFFKVFDHYENINCLNFDAAANNLNIKKHVL